MILTVIIQANSCVYFPSKNDIFNLEPVSILLNEKFISNVSVEKSKKIFLAFYEKNEVLYKARTSRRSPREDKPVYSWARQASSSPFYFLIQFFKCVNMIIFYNLIIYNSVILFIKFIISWKFLSFFILKYENLFVCQIYFISTTLTNQCVIFSTWIISNNLITFLTNKVFHLFD